MKSIGEQNYERALKEDAAEIAAILITEAYSRFAACGCENDFCVQLVGAECVVFGGWNRLKWGLHSGWNPDPHSCTSEFLEKYHQKYPRKEDS